MEGTRITVTASPEDSGARLDAFIGWNTDELSRSYAVKLIEKGRVSVNGKTAALGDRADPEQDRILVDGKPLSVTERKRYILLNGRELGRCRLYFEEEAALGGQTE